MKEISRSGYVRVVWCGATFLPLCLHPQVVTRIPMMLLFCGVALRCAVVANAATLVHVVVVVVVCVVLVGMVDVGCSMRAVSQYAHG